MNRRRGLLGVLGGWSLGATRLWAQHVPETELLHPYLGNSRATLARVKLELPRLADNGFSVPLKVSVSNPVTAQGHVRRLLLLSNRNPRPLMAEFEWGAGVVSPVVSTRVRLSGSQTVFALAQWSDGSWWIDTADVEVTESACLDQT